VGLNLRKKSSLKLVILNFYKNLLYSVTVVAQYMIGQDFILAVLGLWYFLQNQAYNYIFFVKKAVKDVALHLGCQHFTLTVLVLRYD
jgi:hypothetical protein